MPDDVEVADDGWRGALSESFDKVVASEAPIGATASHADEGVNGGTHQPSPAEADSASSSSTESSAEGRARDESGRFVKQETKPAQEKPALTPARPVTGQGAPGHPPVPAAAPALKPPQSWKPEHREKWATLPPDVQAEITRREKEIAQALQARSEAERTAQSFHQAIRPYEAQIRAAGVAPQQYVGNLLRTAHALAYSAPQQKAAIVAGLCQQFGVAPQDLDSALVAAMQGKPQQQTQPQQFRDPRLDLLIQRSQAVSQQRERAAAQRWESVVEKFAQTHEHFEEVGEAAADWIDLWKSQGRRITEQDLEKAYEKACQDNEYVSKQVAQKKAAQAAVNAQASTQRAKAAASSVKSTPGGGNGSASPSGDSWRSHLEESANKAGW